MKKYVIIYKLGFFASLRLKAKPRNMVPFWEAGQFAMQRPL